MDQGRKFVASLHWIRKRYRARIVSYSNSGVLSPSPFLGDLVQVTTVFKNGSVDVARILYHELGIEMYLFFDRLQWLSWLLKTLLFVVLVSVTRYSYRQKDKRLIPMIAQLSLWPLEIVLLKFQGVSGESYTCRSSQVVHSNPLRSGRWT